MTTHTYITHSAHETEELGARIATMLSGGEIIELTSDLGGGKTTFTRGLARGLGISGDITSPTFVVSKVYSGTELELHHYDFYRLGELGIMSEEIREVMDNDHAITVVEWAGESRNLFPRQRLIGITITPMAEESGREVTITVPDTFTDSISNLNIGEKS